ncbi:MAG: YchF family ATPase [Chloroflexota bacterium]|nr:YchF family ATPase [Chloroflexota bacterium]
MQVALLGLPGSGKTTLFNALTGGHAATAAHGGARGSANVGVARVADARLDALSAMFSPRKTTPAVVTYVDLAFPAGALRAETLSADLAGQLRNADALVHVVRAFAAAGDEATADPWRDAEEMELELALADLGVLQRRLERLRTAGRHGTTAERTRNAAEEAVLARIEPLLGEGTPLRALDIGEDEERLLRGFGFLSQKPMLVVINLDEARMDPSEEVVREGEARLAGPGLAIATLSARIEAEIAELPPDEQEAFMRELGIVEPSRDRVVRMTYELLGLISFFTVGEDECRAWTVARGATAVDAAAAIHSDLARGFIRAEVIGHDGLLVDGSLAEARRRGHLRSEGKSYVVRDGDVVHVLFNVAR